MKKFLKRVLPLFFSILLVLPNANGQRIEKDLQETYKANSSTLLDIDSKFGEVKILAWDSDAVEVKANIWVESSRTDYAKELLSQLDAEIGFADNVITVKSVFPDKLNTRKDTKFRIDFTINAPDYLNLDLSSKYGSAYIDQLAGNVNIDVAYGNLNIMELSRGSEKPLNSINLAYSSGSIEEAGWLKLDLSYSKLSIEESQALVVISKYSSLAVDESSSLVLQSKYDTYSVGELNNILAELKYGNLKIEELRKKLEIESDYSSVKVEEVGPEFEMIKIDNTRGGVKLGISESSSFTLNGTAIRGDISVSGMNNLNSKVENSNKYIDGSYGNNPSATVDIQVKEGSVKIDLD